MQAEVTDLVTDGGRVAGIRARTPAGEIDVRADLVVGADGRQSLVVSGQASRSRMWARRSMCSGCA
jgi:2-polyprenyl-6-methoxyphenol hydroxylase-like FAD-dependent oxidoreductase